MDLTNKEVLQKITQPNNCKRTIKDTEVFTISKKPLDIDIKDKAIQRRFIYGFD